MEYFETISSLGYARATSADMIGRVTETTPVRARPTNNTHGAIGNA